jgi:DNA helicase II / ATP-dependent DNA helicase PcrA
MNSFEASLMLSRARHGVVVTTATNLKGRYGPYKSMTSRWWSGLATTAKMDAEALMAHANRLYPLGSV